MQTPHFRQYLKVALLGITVLALFIVMSACTNQETNAVIIPDLPAGESASIDVGKKVNGLVAQDKLVTTALGANLLVNPAFEQGLSGWSSCEGATNFSITSDSVSGNAAKLSTGCYYQTVETTPGTELSLSCQMKVTDTTGWSGMGFGYTNSNFNVLLEAPDQTLIGGTYREYSTNAIAPANTRYASVWTYTDGSMNIDDCKLSGDAPEPPSGELLNNPLFNNQSDWFNCGNANNWNIASDQMNITNTACVYQTINARAALDYTLVCNAKSDGQSFSEIILSALDSNYNSISQEFTVIDNTDFQNKRTELTSPANTSYIAVTLYSEGPTTMRACALTAGDDTPPTPQAPTVAITAPSNGATLANGVNLFVTATANDTDGTVSNVKLYLNNQLVGQENSAPYEWNTQALLQNLVAGSYTLRAEATDNTGQTASNSISFEVEAPVINTTGKGQWSGVQSWPLIATHMANLKDGRVLAWSSYDANGFGGRPNANYTQATIFDPITNSFQDIDNPTHDMFCAGLATLSDGTIFVAGGGDGNNSRRKVSTFSDNTWTRLADMPNPHWYGTAVADSNDDVFVSVGASSNRKTDIYRNGNWSTMPGINLAGITDSNLETPDWYPYMHLSPRGTVFHSGATTKMHELTLNGNGTTTAKGNRNQDGVTGEVYRQWGSAIMIDDGKILMTGGTPKQTNPGSLNTGVLIDINSSNPVVKKVAPMRFSRSFHSTLLLPNGEVLVLGGNGTGVEFNDAQSRLVPEAYNPSTDTWRNLSPMTVPRNYHSTATLLQDGRVLAAGGGLCRCSADHQDGQIYSPAYLFNTDGSVALRPTIATAPNRIGYNQNFTVTISGAGASSMNRFVMIKFSANTHAMNTDLRQDVLEFRNQGNGNYRLTSGSNKNTVTPGYYYLFAVNANGVPSVAKIIQIN